MGPHMMPRYIVLRRGISRHTEAQTTRQRESNLELVIPATHFKSQTADKNPGARFQVFVFGQGCRQRDRRKGKPCELRLRVNIASVQVSVQVSVGGKEHWVWVVELGHEISFGLGARCDCAAGCAAWAERSMGHGVFGTGIGGI